MSEEQPIPENNNIPSQEISEEQKKILAQDFEDSKYVKLPREQYQQLTQTNRIAVLMTAQLVDKFDEILDECAKFENFVRQKKMEAKEMFNAATRPPVQQGQGTEGSTTGQPIK